MQHSGRESIDAGMTSLDKVMLRRPACPSRLFDTPPEEIPPRREDGASAVRVLCALIVTRVGGDYVQNHDNEPSKLNTRQPGWN